VDLVWWIGRRTRRHDLFVADLAARAEERAVRDNARRARWRTGARVWQRGHFNCDAIVVAAAHKLSRTV